MRVTLWAVDRLLRLEVADESYLVGYVEDVTVLVVGNTVGEAQRTLRMLMWQVSRWMTEHGLSLALEKTEVVVLGKGKVLSI